MLKYVKKFENKRPEPVLLSTDASELSHRGGKIRLHSPLQNIRWVRLYKKAERPGVSFQYLYRLLWRIPIVKWNSIDVVICWSCAGTPVTARQYQMTRLLNLPCFQVSNQTITQSPILRPLTPFNRLRENQMLAASMVSDGNAYGASSGVY